MDATFPSHEHDELDMLGPGAPVIEEQPVATRRSTRIQLGHPTSGNRNKNQTDRKVSRKRAISTSGANGRDSEMKKMKTEEKKTQTTLVGKNRDKRDEARKNWLFCHREIVEPLLPQNTKLFQTLEQELTKGRDEKATFIPMHSVDEQPKMIASGQMKDYQLEGLSFMVTMFKNGMNAILGDEMGLGKTLQTLSLFAYIRESEPGPHDPHLVICPLSVLSSWEAEAKRWVPKLRLLRFHGAATERERVKTALRGKHDFDIMLTTYEAYCAEDSWFKSHRWNYCVLDEGHKIKNAETNLAHKVQGIGSMHRLILTGTPVQNNLVELWGLLHWLFPSVFTTATERRFKESFDLEKGSYEIPFLNAARKFLSTIMLRRTKALIAGDDVPPREELTVFIPLTETQRFWTYRLLTKMDAPDLQKIFSSEIKSEIKLETKLETKEEPSEIKLEESFSISAPVLSSIGNQMSPDKARDGGNQWKKLMNLLLQLRKVCDHPYLLPNAELEPYGIAEHIVTTSSKMIIIDKLLKDILPKGDRVLIFSQWTGMLDLLEDFMVLRRIPFARLDGSTPRPRRALDIRLFQQEVSPYKVFLVSTKAGGLGINLTKASHVIMCDSDWNPQNDLQAIARAHRIGQTKIVKVYRLICQGSVEDQMLDRLRRKLFLSLKIMGSDNSNKDESTSLGSNELLDILRRGSSALSRSEDGMDFAQFSEANIKDILEESRALEQKRDAKLRKDMSSEGVKAEDAELLLDAEEEEKRLLSGVAQVQSRLFEGKLVQKQSNADIAREWRDVQKRARVDQTATIGGMTFLIAPSMETASAPAPPPKKRTRAKFESQDWCIYCRDGGELVLCTRCPRVFHAQCHGLTRSEMKRPTVSCSQHNCARCNRNTQDAGGMLYRCRTCPQAFCDDCLPAGELDAVGESLAEFELLGYGASAAAYYIRCHDCRDDYNKSPTSMHWREWTEEIKSAEAMWKEVLEQSMDIV